MPRDAPDEEECLRLLRKRRTPQRVIDHSRAVLYMAEKIFPGLLKQGVRLDRDLIRAGALLHDIARQEPHHAQTGAAWLMDEGYPRVAKIIAEHEDPPEPLVPNESALVCLADKLIQGTEEVSLEDRFAQSLEKCRDEAARRAHDERFSAAKRLRELISVCP
jgi:putative nucleotidyltransferase with HDIG domain